MHLRYNGQRGHWECIENIGGIGIRLWPDGSFFLDMTGDDPKLVISIYQLDVLLNLMRAFAAKEERAYASLRTRKTQAPDRG